MLIYTSHNEVIKTSKRNEIKKTFDIPAGVSPDSIISVVGKDGNLTISAKVDYELARKQQQETIKKSTISQANKNIIHIRAVDTTHNVTSKDLKDIKIKEGQFEVIFFNLGLNA